MNIACHLLGCSVLLQPWALDPGRVKDRALQQAASHLLDFSILYGCLEVLKKNCFLYVNLSDFAPRQPGGAHLGSSPPLAAASSGHYAKIVEHFFFGTFNDFAPEIKYILVFTIS